MTMGGVVVRSAGPVTVLVIAVALAAAAPGSGERPSPPSSDTSPGGGDRLPSHAATFTSIAPGDVVNVSIDDPERVGVSRISIGVVNPARNVEITVTRQDGEPADVSHRIAGTPYRYLEITASNLSNDDISRARVGFDVNATWLDAAEATAEQVQLARYTPDGWTPLPTTVQDRTGDTITYVAETPGFSYFSIFARDDEPDEVVCGNGICQANQTWESCPSDCEKPQYVINAEQAIGTAENRIAYGEDGYDTLQDAQAAYDAGDYSQAATLARQAIEENRTPDRKLIRILIPVLFPFTILFAVIYWKRDMLAKYLSEDENDPPE